MFCKLNHELTQLSPYKATLWGLSCIDRILHLFKNFEEEIAGEEDEYFKDFKVGYSELHKLFNIALSFVCGQNKNPDLTGLIDRTLSYAPDTEDISGINAVIAQNCAIGLSYIFQFIETTDIKFIIYCRDKAADTIDIISFHKNEDDKTLNERLEIEASIEQEAIELISWLPEKPSISDINLILEFDKCHKI